MSQFGPMSSLDFPELAVSMALEGELTARGLRLAAFDPAGLSPTERETIRTKVKQKVGGGPLTGALVDVVMNPLTWLFFATSPAGFGALGSTTQTLFSGSKRMAMFMREHGTALQRLPVIGWGLSTALQEAEGASGATLLTLKGSSGRRSRRRWRALVSHL